MFLKSLIYTTSLLFFINCCQAQSFTGASSAESNSPGMRNAVRGNGMKFTQNKGQVVDVSGQIRQDILYKGEGAGADVYLRKTGISYVYTNMGEVLHKINEEVEEAEKLKKTNEAGEEKLKEELIQKAIIKGHRVDVDFVGCNTNVNIINEDEVEGKLNFYYAHCPQGVTNVNQYNKVIYQNIYDDIDVAWYGNRETGLKYDIIVNPRAEPRLIKLNWTGAEDIHVNSKGNLVIKTSVNEFFESIPKVYQVIDGKVMDVEAKYIISKENKFDSKSCSIGFNIGHYNTGFPLIIDPATWVTYYGGNAEERCGSVATDALGNAVFSGNSISPDFPVTVGAYQTFLNGATASDAFVVKFNAGGVPVFATYFGGSDNEYAGGVTADLNNNIYVTGQTSSGNLPTMPWGAGFMQASNNGQQDAFIAKFDPSGLLVWSTYYGGSKFDDGFDITTDSPGNIYFTGTTLSTNFPTQAPFMSFSGGTEPFVVKFNNTGIRQWATYYGGAYDDEARGITTDINNNVYVCGITGSANFPVLSPFQSVFGGDTDAFLCRLNSATGFPVWSTLYGGGGSSHLEGGYAVAADALGNVFLGMLADSPNTGNVIATPGAYKTVWNGTDEGAVIKFTNAGIRVWGTYLSGSSITELAGLAVDVNNNIIAGGDTYSKDFPVTPCAYQKTFAGSEDQFITVFDQQGQLLCSGFIGIGDPSSPNNETQWRGGCIAVSGCFVYTNAMSSCTYPVTANAFQTLCVGTPVWPSTISPYDAAFSKLYINTCGGTASSLDFNAPASICIGQTVNYTSSNTSCDNTPKTYSWSFPGGIPATSTQQNPSVNYAGTGVYNTKLVVSAACGKDSVTKTIVINPCTITATATPASICPPNTCANITAVGSNGSGPYAYSWSTGAIISTINVCPATSTSYTVKVTDANGNFAFSTATVTVNPSMPPLNPVSTNISCTTSGSAGVSISVGPSYPYAYSWSSGQTVTATISCTVAGGYTLTVTDANGCTLTQPFTITGTSPVSAIFTMPTACVGTNATFINTGTAPGSGVTYYWNIAPVSGSVITSGTTTDFSYTFLTAGTYSVSHTVSQGSCNNIVKDVITVTNCTGPTVNVTGSAICSGSCGAVTSTVSGGTAPYTYSWSTGATAQTINPCPAATTTYTVQVTDAGGVTATTAATVTVNPAVTVTATPTIGCTVNSGSAVANPGGGSSPYTYTWSGGQSTQTATNLAAGNYMITVFDNKGCTSTAITTIGTPLIAQFIKGTASCTGCGCKEWIMVYASDGIAPYSYSWPNNYDKRYQNKLCPGNYAIKVTDKNGCSVNVLVNAP
jgi:PKD repeat protein